MSEPIELVSGVSPMLMLVARSIVWLLCAAVRRPYCCAAMSMPLLRLPAAEPVLRIHRQSPKRSKYSSGHRVHIRRPAIPTEKHKEEQDKRLPIYRNTSAQQRGSGGGDANLIARGQIPKAVSCHRAVFSRSWLSGLASCKYVCVSSPSIH